MVEGGNVPIRLNWQAPHLGQAVSYSIYRFEVVDPEAIFPPATLPTLALDTVFGEGAPPTTYLDSTAPSGRNLAYFVIAHFADESSSGISNFARVTTPAFAPPVTITSVVPATAADGTGQMITLFTAGAPAGTPTALFTQGETTVPGFVFDVGFGSPSHQNEYFVRLPRGTSGNPLLGAGPATVRLVFDQNTFSGDVALTVATTPGTPQARFVLGLGPLAENGCAPLLSTTPITAIAPGQNVAISAYGIDTTGARAVFTQGDNSLDAGVSSCSLTDSAYGIAAVFTVPSGLGPGAVTVQVTATVNGVQSALSSPLTLTVVDATAPVPVAPINSALIQQNRTDIGCDADPNYGSGYQVVFEWRQPSSPPTGISGYNLWAIHGGSQIPIVNTFVSGAQFTYRACNAFVADTNLTGWQWQVQAVYSGGGQGAWSPQADFQFASCRLADGTPCHASDPAPLPDVR